MTRCWCLVHTSECILVHLPSLLVQFPAPRSRGLCTIAVAVFAIAAIVSYLLYNVDYVSFCFTLNKPTSFLARPHAASTSRITVHSQPQGSMPLPEACTCRGILYPTYIYSSSEHITPSRRRSSFLSRSSPMRSAHAESSHSSSNETTCLIRYIRSPGMETLYMPAKNWSVQ